MLPPQAVAGVVGYAASNHPALAAASTAPLIPRRGLLSSRLLLIALGTGILGLTAPVAFVLPVSKPRNRPDRNCITGAALLAPALAPAPAPAPAPTPRANYLLRTG